MCNCVCVLYIFHVQQKIVAKYFDQFHHSVYCILNILDFHTNSDKMHLNRSDYNFAMDALQF